MDLNRKTAYLALSDVEERGAYSNIALAGRVSSEKPDDPAFARAVVYGVLTHKITIDRVLDRYIKSGTGKLKAPELTILRMGTAQLAYMDSVPAYAAVNESVKLAKKYARGRDAFMNGVLRTVQRDVEKNGPDAVFGVPRASFPTLTEYLSVKYSYAPWIIDLWRETFPDDELEELLAAGNEAPLLSLRVNTLRCCRDELADVLAKEGIETLNSSAAENVLLARGAAVSTDAFRGGMFSVQDESSAAAVNMLAPEPGEFVIDVCAAPGGKTLAMAELMKNKGAVIAQDIYEHRLRLIEDSAARLGVNIVRTELSDARVTNEAYAGKADRVLVDAPCSGLGTVRRRPEIKYSEDARASGEVPETQYRILKASAAYVKPGGSLMYSTCTLNKRENEDVVARFLDDNDSFAACGTKTFFPHRDGTDGFFACLMKRK